MTDEELRALDAGDIVASENDRTGKWWSVITGISEKGGAIGISFRFYDNQFFIYNTKNMFFDPNERHATEEDLRAIFNFIFRAAMIKVEQ